MSSPLDRATRQLISSRRRTIAEWSGFSRTETLRALREVNELRSAGKLPPITQQEIEVYPGELDEPP